jgi:hypothetical protein
VEIISKVAVGRNDFALVHSLYKIRMHVTSTQPYHGNEVHYERVIVIHTSNRP